MKTTNGTALVAILAAGVLMLACGKGDLMGPGEVQPKADRTPDTNAGVAARSTERLPFHSEIRWQVEQVPIPEGRCTRPLPPGMSYLWLSRINGTHVSTHLGKGPYAIEICIYGQLTDPTAPPGQNGIPMGWYAVMQVWTAANGDTLQATGELIGFTAPPPTPGFKFIESLRFLDGGTGRFEHAQGEGTGLVDPVAQTAVYEGWIAYHKK